MALPVRTCFNVLTLRQGTILIAIVELFLSTFLLFLLLLCSADAQEMAAVLEADIEDSAQREGIALSDDTSLIEIAPIGGHSQNKIRLHKAQHLALVVIICLYIGVIIATVHLVSGVLLLYGTIMRFRQLMLPWVMIELIGIVLLCTAMFVFMFLAHSYVSLIIFAIGSLIIVICFYNWMVVYSHYIELCELEETTCNVSHHTLKHSYIRFNENAYNL
ncbi:uncharacterized protein LOC142330457 [Lycorma delicatula]|uniref:uncharacterized protein LOC142330457 n=1 Tax=Lycorma delicatula TaxID=130591 RepID=UPI003F5164E5